MTGQGKMMFSNGMIL